MSMPGRSAGTFGEGAESVEARRHQTRARVHLSPDLELVVGRHPVLVQPLPLDVILRHRDQHARVRPREPAADIEPADQRVIDPQLDLMLVLCDARRSSRWSRCA